MLNGTNYENNMTQQEFDGMYAVSDGVRIAHATAIVIFGFTGAVGNFLVILSIATTPDLQTLHNALVLNLSVADFLLSVVILPLYFVSVVLDRWPFGPVSCRLCVKISLLLLGVSVITLATVASNRYLLISKPRGTYEKFCGRKKIIVNIIFMWLQAAFVVFVVAEFIAHVETNYSPIFGTCSLDPFDPNTWVFITVLVVLVVFTSLVAIPLQYYLMFRTIRASKRRVRAVITMSVSVPSDVTTSVASQGALNAGQQPPAAGNHRPSEFSFSKEEIRLVKMSLFVTLLFVICWLPQSITYILGTTYPILFRAGRFEVFLLILGPAGNPFIYAWMNTNMRKACLRLIKCQKCRRGAL